MAMTPESIRNVPPERVHLLLSEPRFSIHGKAFELLSEDELKRKRVANTAGVSLEDLNSEGTSMLRNVANLVSLVDRDVYFGLDNRNDAKLIFTIIDFFLQTQAQLVKDRLGGLKDFMLKDFENLTKLANKMLELVTVADRVDMMNAPKAPKDVYESIFDLMLGDKLDVNISDRPQYQEPEEEGYSSPFSELLKNRKFVNRINRFN